MQKNMKISLPIYLNLQPSISEILTLTKNTSKPSNINKEPSFIFQDENSISHNGSLKHMDQKPTIMVH